MQFADLGLAQPILRAVESSGYSTPTPIQQRAIPVVLQGRDVLGCAQTGTGKTAAFALPILDLLLSDPIPKKAKRWIRALVLSPTRELAAQISDSFHVYGKGTKLRVTTIFGGVGQRAQTRELEAGVDVVVATPGRLLDLINQGYVDLKDVEVFVLDEADQMLDMGFLPDVQRIAKRLPTKRQTLLFSATMPPPIRALSGQLLHDPVSIQIAPAGTATELVEQQVYLVEKKQKPDLLADFLQNRPPASTLVFSRTKYGADAVVKRLEKAGIQARAIHGNKSQSNRQKTLAQFKSGDIDTLVATDIAARGIDVTGIDYVVNYDMPAAPETYVHRIGRTGRAGAVGVAVSFCSPDEREQLTKIERHLKKKITLIADTTDPLARPVATPTKGKPGKGKPGKGKQPIAAGRGGQPRGGVKRSRKRFRKPT
ncbi:DEAD/DEAH box helicase [Planctomycetaceae bacterium SH139]